MTAVERAEREVRLIRWKVRPVSCGPWLHIESLDELKDMTDNEDGEEFELVRCLMTQAEIDALGEFDGW